MERHQNDSIISYEQAAYNDFLEHGTSALKNAKKCRAVYDLYQLNDDVSDEILEKLTTFLYTIKKCKLEYANYALDHKAKEHILPKWVSLLESDDDFEDAISFIRLDIFDLDEDGGNYILENWLNFTKSLSSYGKMYKYSTNARIKKMITEKWDEVNVDNLSMFDVQEDILTDSEAKELKLEEKVLSLTALDDLYNAYYFKDDKRSKLENDIINNIPNLKSAKDHQDACNFVQLSGVAHELFIQSWMSFLKTPEDYYMFYELNNNNLIFKNLNTKMISDYVSKEDFFIRWNEVSIKNIPKIKTSKDYNDAYNFAPFPGEAREMIADSWLLSLKTINTCKNAINLCKHSDMCNRIRKKQDMLFAEKTIKNIPNFKSSTDYQKAYWSVSYKGACEIIAKSWVLFLKTPEDFSNFYHNNISRDLTGKRFLRINTINISEEEFLSRWNESCVGIVYSLKSDNDFKKACDITPVDSDARKLVYEAWGKVLNSKIMSLIKKDKFEEAYDLSITDMFYDADDDVVRTWFLSLNIDENCKIFSKKFEKKIKRFKDFIEKFEQVDKFNSYYKKAIHDWDQMCVIYLLDIKRGELDQMLEYVPENGVAMRMIKMASLK